MKIDQEEAIFSYLFFVYFYKKLNKGLKMKFRCSHQRCSERKGVLRNFAKFTGKQLCQSHFLNKVTDLEKLQTWKFIIFFGF